MKTRLLLLSEYRKVALAGAQYYISTCMVSLKTGIATGADTSAYPRQGRDFSNCVLMAVMFQTKFSTDLHAVAVEAQGGVLRDEGLVTEFGESRPVATVDHHLHAAGGIHGVEVVRAEAKL